MVFEYDQATDMLYIRLGERASTGSEEVAPGVVLDFAVVPYPRKGDAQNHIVGVEIEDASKVVDLSRLEFRALPVVDRVLSERVLTGD